MEGHPHALVASSYLECRRVLLRILEDLRVNTFASATLAEAEEVLSRKGVALVFCDDRLEDGSYRDLLQTLRTLKRAPHIVVTTRTGEWKEYLEALGLGAFDMIQYPYRSTDVELNVFRAMRGRDQKSDRAVAWRRWARLRNRGNLECTGFRRDLVVPIGITRAAENIRPDEIATQLETNRMVRFATE